MKLLAVFMTILMLFTGFDLCEDQDSSENEGRVEVGKTSDDNHQEEEPCTPFCHCARCPFSVVLPSVSRQHIISFLKIEKFDGYISPTPIQFSPSIWQPPKYS